MARYRLFLVLIAAFACSPLFSAAPAAAQSWLAPAFSGIAPLGPEKAKGAVIWSHGRSVNSEDSEVASPDYMATLRDAGWDAFRFNRMRDGDTLEKSAGALVRTVQKLKQQGYRKVALAGQSFGGFLALMAADASDQVDAVVATAPAAYGSFQDYYGSWRSNATKLYPLLERVKSARVMVFFFHGDDFDPGGRGDRAEQILSARHIGHVVVDQPAQLTTHWAATTPLFTRRYGGCIAGFLEAQSVADDASCHNDALMAGSPGNSSGQLQGGRPNGG